MEKHIFNPYKQEKNHLMDDRIFVRKNNKLVKLLLDDILFLEAERNYCKISTLQDNYLVVSPLIKLYEKIKHGNFIRVHRSFVVNLTKLDAVAESYLEINRIVIPVSKMYKENLFQNLNRI